MSYSLCIQYYVYGTVARCLRLLQRNTHFYFPRPHREVTDVGFYMTEFRRDVDGRPRGQHIHPSPAQVGPGVGLGRSELGKGKPEARAYRRPSTTVVMANLPRRYCTLPGNSNSQRYVPFLD